MPLSKFESMLKTNEVYFFDATEFQHIIEHYFEIGKHSLVRKALQLGLEQHPTSTSLKLLYVELLIFEDKLPKAIKILNEIEAIEPFNDEVFLQKATILSKKGRHKEAIDVLKSSLQYTEDAIDIWSMIGMEYLYLDDYENARLNFAKCVDVDYEDYSSLYNIIYCFEMKEDYETAITFLNKYIDKNPYSEVAWHQLGRQYFTLNMFNEALTAFDYAIIIDETFIGGYLEKAKTLEELNRYEEAIENYMVTLELDDPTAFAYVRIGECFDKLEVIETAIQYYKKAVNEDPLLDKGWLLLTESFCKQGNYTKAMYYINKAIQIDEDNPMYWRKYANINIKLNFFDKAVKALYKCVDLGDVDIEVYVALADVLLFLENYKDALAVLISAKKIYQNFAEIEYRLCGLFMKTNQKEHSLKHLKNALAIDYDYHKVIKDLYPQVFNKAEVKKVIANYKKAVS